VVEFGAGSARKTPHLLRAIDPAAYVPIDISGDFLHASSTGLAATFPGLPVLPLVADFTGEVVLPPAIAAMPKLGFFPGSTIGNLEPHAAVDLLRAMRGSLGTGAMLMMRQASPPPSTLTCFTASTANWRATCLSKPSSTAPAGTMMPPG
jgi:uncharacterized SAM-dependent methyltransferase